MYAHSNANIPATNEIPCVYSPPSSSTPEFFGHFSASSLPAPLAIPVNEYESSCALKSEFSYTSTSSGCSSYSSPTSLTSYATTNYNSSYYSSPTSLTSYESNYNANLMQRSISSHSLLHRNNVEGFSALVSSPTACYDSETSPFRKVFSAGDLEYECRKTLADSRPRIRGRFARNDEIEKASQNQWDQAGIEEEDEDDDNWINILDTFSTTLIP
ncbi:uncharacterized protein [Coffea arabica]|uniref:Uncharacterized protein isoform X3 n=1 Tax=Coffea arabica TaxID=13443 RepID=A0ABM4V9L5_COFAR